MAVDRPRESPVSHGGTDKAESGCSVCVVRNGEPVAHREHVPCEACGEPRPKWLSHEFYICVQNLKKMLAKAESRADKAESLADHHGMARGKAEAERDRLKAMLVEETARRMLFEHYFDDDMSRTEITAKKKWAWLNRYDPKCIDAWKKKARAALKEEK